MFESVDITPLTQFEWQEYWPWMLCYEKTYGKKESTCCGVVDQIWQPAYGLVCVWCRKPYKRA